MKASHFTINRKYFWMEFGFIFFLSFAITLISDLEYSAYVQHNISKFSDDFGYRVVTESLALICYGIYYWGFLKVYVFRRSLLGVILCSIAFVILDHIFDKYVTNWILAHTDFISTAFRKRALDELRDPRIVFTFNYALISTIFPLTGLAFVVRSFSQDNELKTLKEQQLLSELNYLKAQLHPHFFFNTINNIYGLALKQSTDTAPMVARLGEMMRYILYEADQETVPLSREIAFLSGYIEVEKIRHQKGTNIQFDVQGILPEYRIEPLLLLPFIENAFKHGLEEETGNGFVHIVICQTDEDLTLQVSNSIPESAKGKEVAGIGIKNVRKRLDILYPGRYQLEMNEAPGIYEVTLILPNV
ncbi:sensor histidine kinase [Mucilaginibacter flavidus]|uniref:sensor histidine kinase n=1 Tax=Mucilaginibacter flavidus TaxID=2949309 RepID=UPI002092F653|nr:histidine kinase [Mucilaginibacter flavidus]